MAATGSSPPSALAAPPGPAVQDPLESTRMAADDLLSPIPQARHHNRHQTHLPFRYMTLRTTSPTTFRWASILILTLFFKEMVSQALARFLWKVLFDQTVIESGKRV